jgi:hypothetical protein
MINCDLNVLFCLPWYYDKHASRHVDGDHVVRKLTFEDQVHWQATVLSLKLKYINKSGFLVEWRRIGFWKSWWKMHICTMVHPLLPKLFLEGTRNEITRMKTYVYINKTLIVGFVKDLFFKQCIDGSFELRI